VVFTTEHPEKPGVRRYLASRRLSGERLVAQNVLGTGVEVRRDDVTTWLSQVVPAYAVHALMVLWVTAAAGDRSVGWLLLASIAFALATIVLEAALRRQRRLQGTVAVLLRVAVAAVQLGVGLWLVLGVDGDGWRFIGVTSLLLVAGTVRSEVRYSIRWMHSRGRVVLGVAGLLVALGLWPIAAIAALAGAALAGYGVVGAMLGAELLTEDWLRSLPRWSPRTMRRIGAGLLVLAAALLVGAGAEPAYVVLLFMVLLVIVATVASDSDGAEVVVLLTIALFWATAPRQVAPVAAIDPQPGEPFFVALGDSYISGEGAERFFEGTNDKQGNECRRAPTAHPVLLAQRGGPAIPDRVLFLACSGALGVDLYGDRPGRTEPVSQLDQYRNALTRLDAADAEFVLLSIGGNDAGFGEVGQACVGPGSCSEIGARWIRRLDDVREKLHLAYGAVEEAVDVPVHVVPYPVPLAEHGCWWSWLTDDEVSFLTGFVSELNGVIEDEAAEHGFDVVETIPSTFAEEELRICDRFWPGQLGMNFIAMNPTSGSLGDVVNPRNWLHNSLHPNEAGHEALFRAVETWITDPPAAMPDEEPMEARADPCGGEDPPAPCTQRTSEWQSVQLRSLLRRAAVPVGVALVGGWILLAPTLRWATERQVNLGRFVLALLGRLARWLRGLLPARAR
jgi:hypothetical protein